MNFKERRKKLYASIGNRGHLFLHSGFTVHRSADDTYPFSVNRNFYYFTGIDQENTSLFVDLATQEEVLIIYENDPHLTRWVGEYYTKDEVCHIAEVEQVDYQKNWIVWAKKASQSQVVFLDLFKSNEKGNQDVAKYFQHRFKRYCSTCQFQDIYSKMLGLRARKDAQEIDMLRRAIACTDGALQQVMLNLPRLKNECQVQAMFESSILSSDNGTPAFQTIAASGKNATILHYHQNNADLQKNAMILLDLGARIHYYNADISRTYPVSGHFNGLEKEIYQTVLECNKYIIAAIRPGIGLRQLQAKTIEFFQTICLQKGWIQNKEEIQDVYYHSVSHHLGLDVHDPMGRDTILEVGNIITVEPGLYFSRFGIGVRIEDDILVTEDGYENLSQDIIKEIDDIENFMRKGE